MKTVRWTGIALLFFLAASAIIGSLPMLSDPHGTPWNMPQSFLQYSPFRSYLVPGIILLAANGLLSLWALWLALAHRRRYSLWTAFQGCVLLGWLVAECILIRIVAWPHYLYGVVAVGLIAAGTLLRRDEKRCSPYGDGI